MLHPFSAAERLMRYVQIDTQSDPNSHTSPTTAKQKNLSALLVEELKALGIEDAFFNEFGYVYATIPANTIKEVPVICFCSHIDTAPDCSGTHVKPILHKNYQGELIVLPDDPQQILSVNNHPQLANYLGDDIITASGNTLLGADDKAGVAIIMNLVEYLMAHPSIKHGTIKILFTPDEEVGRGADLVDLQQLGAQFAYTLDGGAAGSLEDENFSADGVVLTINGVIAHPGAAKNKMVNALKLAGEILAALPKNEWCPEATEHKQGFVHPVRMEGLAEKATIEWLIRDFETSQLKEYEERLLLLAKSIVSQYPGASVTMEVNEQYRNMKEILDQFPQVVNYAKKAYELCGITPIIEPIRGGTDGSRLSFMGLPTANLFTGMQSIHSKQEWIAVGDMQKSVNMLVQLVQVWEQNA